MLALFNKLIRAGITPANDFYERTLKIAVNLLSINGILFMLLASFYGFFVEHDKDVLLILTAIPFYLFVFLLNRYERTEWSITLMFVSGNILLAFFSLRGGEAALTHILFVLNVIGLSILYRKGRFQRFFYGNMLFTLLCIVFVLLSFYNNWFISFQVPQENVLLDIRVNTIILVFCSLMFSMIVVVAFSRQYNRVLSSLEEKQILLAELNHRVKNNLAIIVSLLRLKGMNATNDETVEALRDVANRVHSMALVHQQMYDGVGNTSIRVQEYISELMSGICNSLPDHPDVTCTNQIDDVEMDVSKAIPFGMILNELIMNTIKHAFPEKSDPELAISYKETDDIVTFTFSDNGIGFRQDDLIKEGSLGIELILSLAEQLDAKAYFKSENGTHFEMHFKKNS